MKKLLMVTNAPICPVINGSRKRMYNLVKLLEKAGFEVQIVISNDRVGYMSTKEQMPNKVHFFDFDRKKESCGKNCQLRHYVCIQFHI